MGVCTLCVLLLLCLTVRFQAIVVRRVPVSYSVCIINQNGYARLYNVNIK